MQNNWTEYSHNSNEYTRKPDIPTVDVNKYRWTKPEAVALPKCNDNPVPNTKPQFQPTQNGLQDLVAQHSSPTRDEIWSSKTPTDLVNSSSTKKLPEQDSTLKSLEPCKYERSLRPPPSDDSWSVTTPRSDDSSSFKTADEPQRTHRPPPSDDSEDSSDDFIYLSDDEDTAVQEEAVSEGFGLSAELAVPNTRVPPLVQSNLRTLISCHDDGIWCSKLPIVYRYVSIIFY